MKVTAIVGSYRKQGTVDRVIDAILAAAREAGAETGKMYLIDKHIEFCTNCRSCTQEAGARRGACPLADDMHSIFDELESSDAIVLGTSVNFYTVTAVMKKLLERLVCYAYWPWGMLSPKVRAQEKTRRAVLVISSAAPSFMIRFRTGIVGIMKTAAGMLGAKTIGVLTIGIAARAQKQDISRRTLRKARLLGAKLVSG
jgi:putative NADPH-quinone reductase